MKQKLRSVKSMASVKFKGFPAVRDKIKEEFEKIRKDPELLRTIADASQKDIVGFTRSGKSPKDRKTFDGLSESWYKKRDYLLKYNSPGEYFLYSLKSNLTFTGKLLESIKFKIVPSQGEVVIEPEGNHDGYKTKSGRTKSIPNKKLVGYLASQGREFLFVSDALRKRINVLTKAFIRRMILKKKF